jgi:calcium binding protein
MNKLKKDPIREERIQNQVMVDTYGPEESAMGWYYYLENQLQFPFEARCIVAKIVHRSVKVKPSTSLAWRRKMPAPPTSS